MSNLFTIGNITFDDPTGSGQDLEYPLYNDVIDYGIVDPDVRKAVQLEPAFQFLAAAASPTCEFVLQLAAAGTATFAAASGQPIWKEAAGATVSPGPLTSVEMVGTDRKTCKVVFEPSAWPTSAPHVIVLRVFCNRSTDRPNVYQPRNGVSLVFIRPGGTQIGSSATRTPPPAALDITVTGIGGLPPAATYDIFQAGFPLPADVSLEPAFRLSETRPEARVKIELGAPLIRFVSDATHGDGVPLIHRSSVANRPPELSQVPCAGDQKSIRFSWIRPASEPGHLAFGFFAPVEMIDTRTGQWLPKEVFIDPILYHDPPPGG